MSWISAMLGIDAAKKAGKASNAQNAIANQQLQMMQQASPYYGQLLQWFAQNAGLRMPGMQTPGIAGPIQQPGQAHTMAQPGFGSSMDRLAAMRAGGQQTASTQPVGGTQGIGQAMKQFGLPNTYHGGGRQAMMQHPLMGGMNPAAQQGGADPMWAQIQQARQGAGQPGQPGQAGQQPYQGLPNSALGIYGSNPADVYRMQQAQEQIDQLANQRSHQLQYQLGQQGIGNSATAGAALQRNQQDALSQLANFRRNLAMNAGTEQERRMQQLFSMLGMGQGAGGQASSIYGQQAGLQQQAGQNQQNLLMQILQGLF